MRFIIVFSCFAPGTRDSANAPSMLTGCKFIHTFFAATGTVTLFIRALPCCRYFDSPSLVVVSKAFDEAWLFKSFFAPAGVSRAMYILVAARPS